MTPRKRVVRASVTSARRRRRGRSIDPTLLAEMRHLLDEMREEDREAKPAPTFEERGRESAEGPSFGIR